MSKPGHRLLKNLAGDSSSLQRYPRFPPPRDLETPTSIYSNKNLKRSLVDITSPTKRTRASDVKPRTKCKRSDTWANGTLETEATEGGLQNNPYSIRSDPISPEVDPPEVDFEVNIPEPETVVLQSSHSPSGVHPGSFAEYLEAVNGGCTGYNQIARGLCVVQGWDVKRTQTTSHWYHLQFIDVNGSLKLACQCPIDNCFHKRYLREYHDEKFASVEMKYPSGSDRSCFDNSRPILTQDATLYTLLGSFDCRIKLQICPKYPSSRTKHIGPDLRELGVFNYNNSRLLTHELLDDYTNVFSSSETPFDAWCENVLNCYSYTPGNIFMSKDSFRACWFAYARLQSLEGDFQCPDYGPHPETVVWDGVSLSFGLCKLSGSLEPPTKTSSSSPIRPNVRYFPKQQLIPESTLWKLLRKALKMEPLNTIADNASTASSPQKSTCHAKQSQHAVNVVSDHMDNIVLVTEQLKRHNNGSKVLKVVASFLKQIAAEESVLQMVNREGLRALDIFLRSPKPATASGLIVIPHLYLLLEWGYERKAGYQQPIISIATWIHDRARDVLDTLLANSMAPALLKPVMEPIDTNWEVTGCFYSMPKIRERPTYPLLIHDKQKDDPQKESREQSDGASPPCGKYYSTYKERRLTGGIMVAWCPHSISYGYHCMPGSPKRVVYDFSCALGPYCLLREPDFFVDMLFIIDNFHARDHTKCANACFASTYAKLDPELSEVNTSTAECGNSLIL
ncbi:hypothetical protein NP233_g4468 [Leucocoprinus birnbaumii]|uniref:HMG domain-containing protein n=1 Tax=Leucocoprinus birnbaumii TaxID=56174 RepID=A0AAD5VXC4_9AGAR|nr:hypothetical protein NP233_g4468 [Leucocoprinus birnbaumii]